MPGHISQKIPQGPSRSLCQDWPPSLVVKREGRRKDTSPPGINGGRQTHVSLQKKLLAVQLGGQRVPHKEQLQRNVREQH